MSETESPADELRRLIAEDKDRKFAKFTPFREVIQEEYEISQSQRTIIRYLKLKNIVVSRYALVQYLRHIGLIKRTKHRKKPAQPTV